VELTIVLAIVALTVALAFAVQLTRRQTAAVSIEQLREYLGNGAVLLDVRSPREYAGEHLKGAINIPHDDMEQHEHDLPADKLTPIVVYSRSGAQASVVEQTLRGMGYGTVINGGAYEALKDRL
jgi:phage shock protein E